MEEDDDEIDRGAITPRVSESWLFFQTAAKDLADRLERFFPWLTVDQRYKGRELVGQLRQLEKQFSSWPSAPAEQVATERLKYTRELVRINREVEELLKHMKRRS